MIKGTPLFFLQRIRFFAKNRKQGKITQKSCFQSPEDFICLSVLVIPAKRTPKQNGLRQQVIELAHKLGRAKQDGLFLFHMPSAGVAWLGAGEFTSKMTGKLALAVSWKLS